VETVLPVRTTSVIFCFSPGASFSSAAALSAFAAVLGQEVAAARLCAPR
jgi:hypothetical protein